MRQFIVLSSLFALVAANAFNAPTPMRPWDSRSENNKERNPASDLFAGLYPAGPAGLTRAQAEVNELKTLLLGAERKLNNFCGKPIERPIQRSYGETHYKLTVNVTGCREDGLEVGASQRLVALHSSDSRCKFILMTPVPLAVDSNSAFWRYKDEQVNVLFPYRDVQGENRCDILETNVHRLPKFEADMEDPDVDVRLED